MLPLLYRVLGFEGVARLQPGKGATRRQHHTKETMQDTEAMRIQPLIRRQMKGVVFLQSSKRSGHSVRLMSRCML